MRTASYRGTSHVPAMRSWRPRSGCQMAQMAPTGNMSATARPFELTTVQDVRPQLVIEITGGQGTINVNSRAPDSRRFAWDP